MAADKVLQAYAYSILAKDASGRYSNPRRALRSYEDIMAVANPGSSLLDELSKLIDTKDSTSVKVDERTRPEPQYVTKKMFYDFKNDIVAEFKKLAPPPVTP